MFRRREKKLQILCFNFFCVFATCWKKVKSKHFTLSTIVSVYMFIKQNSNLKDKRFKMYPSVTLELSIL